MSQIQTAGDAEEYGSDVDRYIGERVHTLMFRNHITQAQLGKVLGTSQTGVARRLRGQISWKSTDLVLAARTLNSSVGYLVGEVAEWAPWGSNPRPADYKGDGWTLEGDAVDDIELAQIISIDQAPRFRELMPA